MRRLTVRADNGSGSAAARYTHAQRAAEFRVVVPRVSIDSSKALVALGHVVSEKRNAFRLDAGQQTIIAVKAVVMRPPTHFTAASARPKPTG